MTSPSTRSASPSADTISRSLESEQSISLGWLDALVRHRTLAYTLLTLVYFAAFNGIWRIGVDSALYRGLARSLARDGTYTFAGEHHTHAFAGFPMMLAVLEKVFGESPLPGLILISLMALASLWLIDATLRLRFPLWVATIVTLGVGLNFRFMRQTQELMTDIPFMFGTMMTLYAYERLKLSTARNVLLAMGSMLVAGLVVAAATRPTFGVLVVAIILASGYSAVTNRDGRRGLHLAIVGGAVFIAALLILADPRTVITAPFTGKYELELRDAVRDLPETIWGKLKLFLGENLNDSFFSQDMSPLAIPFSLLLLVGGGLVWKRVPAWGMMIFGLALVTLPLSTVPRYYIMVMPLIWVGWIVLLSALTLRSPAVMRGAVMMIGISLPLVLNVGRIGGFILEQRHCDWIWITKGVSRQDAFYSYYRKGVVQPLLGVAQLVAANTKPSDTIIGPSAHVLSYFADRRVLGERTIFFEKKLSVWPDELKKSQPDYVVGPTRLYEVTDPTMRDMLRRRILIPMRKIASGGTEAEPFYLSTATVIPPEKGVKWTDYMGTARIAPATRISASERAEILRKKARKLEIAKRERKERREKIERREKLERKEKLERRAKLERKEKLERRAKLEKRRRLEIRQRREQRARESQDGQPTTNPANPPATAPTTAPLSLDDFPLIQLPEWMLAEKYPGACAV